MIEVAIMIEGQNGLNWARWQRIARAVEDLGFVGLYRSDHYTNANPPDLDSLELWISLTWLASNTNRIEFGPMVSPVSFRHPTLTARMAAAVDDLSNGRLHLGIGAGWQHREHNNYGWDLLDIPGRFARFEEGAQVITQLLNSDTPVNFEGKYYRLEDAILLPRPQRRGGPPIIVGGKGPKRTLPMVAKYAQEWNAVFLPADEIKRLTGVLDDILQQHNRQPADVKRSLMTGVILGRSDADIQRILSEERGGATVEQQRERGVVIGTPNEIVQQLGEIADAGIYRVMLQWLSLDDLDGLEYLAKTVLPQVK
ncbi:MAG: LLM class F420-dependent oxidoreductase [Anaerolineae bacterium]|nr:LLM class F420-dependent oxidoreductase [Anaerolineae bacterium]